MSNGKRKLPARRSEIDQFLAKVKATPRAVQDGQGRLLFGLDATMSRQPLWDQASQLHAEMFLETAKNGDLHVQLAYYRGLLDFRYTNWVKDPHGLIGLMTSIQCQAGRTQIGRLFQHVLSEARRHKVNAAVFVGDAVEEDERTLYKLAGQLGMLKTPLFIFQEGYDPEAQQVFSKTAQLSGGACCRFDEGSVSQLRQLLGAVAKYARGGYRALRHYAERQGNTPEGKKALELIRQLPAPGGQNR